ncbi:MAG: site-specific integrase [Cellulomonas sp.]
MNGTSRTVSVFALAVRVGRPKPNLVKWRVAGHDKSRSFQDEKAADHFRAVLMTAARQNDPFDIATGEPVAYSGNTSAPTCLELAVEVVARDWRDIAAKSNQGIIQGLATCLPHLVPESATRRGFDRQELERALQVHLTPGDTRVLTTGQTDALRWLTGASSRITEVTDSGVRRALAAASTWQDGTTAASEKTYARKRAALSKVFTAAIAGELITASPLRRLDKAARSKAGAIVPIDPIEVTGVVEVRALLAQVSVVRYRLALQLMFFAGLRPSEVAGLRVADCHLPAAGRCELHVRRASTEVNKRFNATGKGRDERRLKHRKIGQMRKVPIPAPLAALLRAAVAGKGADDLVVSTRSGAAVSVSNIAAAYKVARERWGAAQLVLPPERQMPVPYSLRHAAATLWLKVMPQAEVASRLGNSVAVLAATYMNVIPSEGEHYNQALDRLLGE